MNKKFEIFISYASQDREIAYSLCEYLEKNGLLCWIAPRNISPSQKYSEAIIRGIIQKQTLMRLKYFLQILLLIPAMNFTITSILLEMK